MLTLGPALEEVIRGTADALEKYLLDEIGNVLLGCALQSLEDHLCRLFGLKRLSIFRPVPWRTGRSMSKALSFRCSAGWTRPWASGSMKAS